MTDRELLTDYADVERRAAREWPSLDLDGCVEEVYETGKTTAQAWPYLRDLGVRESRERVARLQRLVNGQGDLFG